MRFTSIIATAAVLVPMVAHAADYVPAWVMSAKAMPSAGGTITSGTDATTATQGALSYSSTSDTFSKTFTVAPSAQYDLKKVTINGVVQPLTGPYTISYDANRRYQSLTAVFAKKTYTVTPPAAPLGGKVAPAKPVTLQSGASKVFLVSPLPGYEVDTITVTPPTAATVTAVAKARKVSFSNVTEAASFTATFRAVYNLRPVITATPSPIYNLPAEGKLVTLDGKYTKCTLPGAKVNYAWSVTDPTGAAVTTAPVVNKPAQATFTATLPGRHVVVLTASTIDKIETKTFNVDVFTQAYTRAQKCAACHNTNNASKDAQGAAIVASYNVSPHVAGTTGPTCTSCHTNTGATAKSHYANTPPTCAVCHNINHTAAAIAPSGIASATGIANDMCSQCHNPHSTEGVRAPHYGGAFGGSAQFVANNATCADCHAGGNVTANGEILKQYAESGHGDVNGPAWETSGSHDWPTNASCRPCHSTTGFIAKVGGTTSKTPVTAGAGQTLACDACHTDLAVDGAVRPAPQYVAGYKSQSLSGATWTLANATFPNVNGENNVCITCHAGRESGESIKALTDSGMNNVSFKNPHYLGAAGMMYAKLGYNFAGQDDVVPGTTTSYGKTLTANEDGGSLTSTHRKLGTTAINGDSHSPLFVPGFLDSDGPCVTCHMGNAADHTWEINATAFNNVCVVCHDEEAGTPLTADNFQELFIEEQAVPFNDAIDLAIATLKTKFNIRYSDAYPYFYDDSLNPSGAVKDWTRGGTLDAAQAKHLMSACLNIKLMKADPAAFVHSRTYARRLLYDTIDWLDDKTLNLTTGATAIAWSPTKYVKGATAAAPTTESAKYLIKYNRTSLVWDAASERP